MLRLDDGTVIDVEDTPRQGTRHRVMLGRERRSGDRVVVKVERVEGALQTERLALEWVSAHGGPAPRLRNVSCLSLLEGRNAATLVMDYREGAAPDSDQGWYRLGTALATLAELPWERSGLRVYNADTFGDAHAARVRDLSEVLRQATMGVDDRDQLTSPQLDGQPPLVLTHGDPSPGNFLDNGATGTLIDWEYAHVAPCGLDLARGMLVALLGVAPAGFTGRDRLSCAEAIAMGYFAGLHGTWRPTQEELRWWLTVAGIQFAHSRFEDRGKEGALPFIDAIGVLAAALSEDDGLISRAAMSASRTRRRTGDQDH